MGLFDKLDALDRRFAGDPTKRRERTRRDRVVWGCIAAVPLIGLLVAATWNGVHDRRVAAELRHDGVEVPAQVVDYRSWTKWTEVFGADAKVAFETDSHRRVETWVTVGTFVDKGPVRIRYLRSNPAVARLVTDTAPRAIGLPLLGGIWTFCGLIALALSLGFRSIDRSLGVREPRARRS